MNFLRKYHDVFFATLLYFGTFVWILAPVLIDRTHVVVSDLITHYGLFHYFWESVKQGVLPLWNPYHHGGEPFYFNFSAFAFLDPTMLVPLAIVRLFDPDLLLLYHWYNVFRETL